MLQNRSAGFSIFSINGYEKAGRLSLRRYPLCPAIQMRNIFPNRGRFHIACRGGIKIKWRYVMQQKKIFRL